jgi:hypothetical protein
MEGSDLAKVKSMIGYDTIQDNEDEILLKFKSKSLARNSVSPISHKNRYGTKVVG